MSSDESAPKEQGPPKGIDFVFETAVKAVEKQLETIDRLDAKIGVVWGLQSASVIWLLGSLAKRDLNLRAAAPPQLLCGLTLSPLLPVYLFTVGLLSLAAGFIFAFAGLLPRDYSLPVNLQELVAWRAADASDIRHHFTEGVVRAYADNQHRLERKGRLLKLALRFSAAGIVIIAGALVGARLLGA